MTLPVTRAEALQIGSRYYFTGQPCKHGHTEKRHTATWTCARCKHIGKQRCKPAYYKRHPDKHHQAKPETQRVWKKAWRLAHPDKERAARKRQSQRPVIRIRRHLRKRIGELVKGLTAKSALVGCSAAELKVHLERQFWPGMTWDNYGAGDGKWNVDHRVPLAAFCLDLPGEREKACHFSNLQPLWHLDNIRKGAKITAC